jgi:transposase
MRLFTRRGYTVLKVLEGMTSKRCFGCQAGECSTFLPINNRRATYDSVTGVWKGERIVTCWGLTRCDYCGRTWNRDVNGALNILRLAIEALVHGNERPAYLCVPPRQE